MFVVTFNNLCASFLALFGKFCFRFRSFVFVFFFSAGRPHNFTASFQSIERIFYLKPLKSCSFSTCSIYNFGDFLVLYIQNDLSLFYIGVVQLFGLSKEADETKEALIL